MADIEFLRKQMIDAAKRKITQKYENKDIHIIKSVNILEDIDPISNLLIEQLREWHSVHFPELNDLVKDNDVYVKLVSGIGKREDFSEKSILVHTQDNELAKNLAQAAQKSIGSNVSEKDLGEIKSLALNCLNLRKEREDLTKYLEQTMNQELPNYTELAGAVIGAKILAKLGSKKRLAFAPASTIQMVGAEKSLFMHFRKGTKGPKYGYLFQHPLVKGAKDQLKGRIARSLAAKLCIAAKKDYFGNTSGAEDLQKQLDERIEALGKITKIKPAPEPGQEPERRGFREYSDRPRREFSPRPQAGGFAERKEWKPRSEFRRDYKPRGEGREEGFRPRREFSERPRRPFDGPRTEFTPRPRRTFDGPRAEFGSRPKRSFDGPRPEFKKREGFKFVPRETAGARPEYKPHTACRDYKPRTEHRDSHAAGGHHSERKPFSKDSFHKRPFGGRKIKRRK